MNDLSPLVSISCVTYNHSGFIRSALDGFLMQQTSFPFEVLIYDDASTDGNAEIIREYEVKNPGIFYPIYQTENQHSKGLRGIAARFNYPRARGKYIALCEGDDYWTDPLKLQRQVDFLEAHEDYTAVAENGMIYFTDSGHERLFSKEPERDVVLIDLVKRRRFPTASVLLRKSIIESYLQDVKLSNDTILWCYLASKGKFRYFPVVSSVYRRGMHGVVLSTETMNWAKIVEKWNNELIRLFSPRFFEKKLAYHNIWDHYWKAYKKYSELKEWKKAGFCLSKCLRYDLNRTLSNFFIRRLPVKKKPV